MANLVRATYKDQSPPLRASPQPWEILGVRRILGAFVAQDHAQHMLGQFSSYDCLIITGNGARRISTAFILMPGQFRQIIANVNRYDVTNRYMSRLL